MSELKTMIVRNNDPVEKREGLLNIIFKDNTLSDDMIENAIKQYISYNFVRILSPVLITDIDIFKISDEFFNKFPVMTYLKSTNPNAHSLLSNMIIAEMGKIVSITEAKSSGYLPNDTVDKITKEVDTLIEQCVKSLRK